MRKIILEISTYFIALLVLTATAQALNITFKNDAVHAANSANLNWCNLSGTLCKFNNTLIKIV